MTIWVVSFIGGMTAGIVYGLMQFTRWSQEEERAAAVQAVPAVTIAGPRVLQRTAA